MSPESLTPGPLEPEKLGETSDPGHPQPQAAEVESARLLANQARPELGAAGFSDQRIDELASEFIARDIGEGLEQFLRWAQAEGQLPQGTSELF